MSYGFRCGQRTSGLASLVITVKLEAPRKSIVRQLWFLGGSKPPSYLEEVECPTQHSLEELGRYREQGEPRGEPGCWDSTHTRETRSERRQAGAQCISFTQQAPSSRACDRSPAQKYGLSAERGPIFRL
ncbi:hypothetical protein NDU88_007483 [Pleurodeles waltl]|uniref:Uncharacterized protein n=1 Tax=Pleurodeles waltl TaxID=8319 RepID=A0AAV7PP54_PLEWA|nr:hypothetical protein NDU88_007483 [Pleurodeles waltl]